MLVADMFPDVGEIRRLFANVDSKYAQQDEKDRDLGRVLELVCRDLTRLVGDGALLTGGRDSSTFTRLQGEAWRYIRHQPRDLNADVLVVIGEALDCRGWPKPPSAVEELREFGARASSVSFAWQRIRTPDVLQAEAQQIAQKACEVSRRYVAEFRQLDKPKRGNFGKIAKGTSAFTIALLAYVGGVNDVPEAYDRLTDLGRAAYQAVIQYELTEQPSEFGARNVTLRRGNMDTRSTERQITEQEMMDRSAKLPWRWRACQVAVGATSDVRACQA